MTDLGGPAPLPSQLYLFCVKKEEMTEGRKAAWGSKIDPGPLLSSKSGSATGIDLSGLLLWIFSVSSKTKTVDLTMKKVKLLDRIAWPTSQTSAHDSNDFTENYQAVAAPPQDIFPEESSTSQSM